METGEFPTRKDEPESPSLAELAGSTKSSDISPWTPHGSPLAVDGVSIDDEGVAYDEEPAPAPLGSIRAKCMEWALSKRLDNIVMTAIGLNCILLAMADPKAQPNEIPIWVLVAEFLFSALFFVECAIKMVAYSPCTYLSDAWNKLDFVVVLESLVSVVLEYGGFNFQINLSILRVLRVLRPLRSVNKFPMLKCIVNATIASMPMLSDIFIVYFAYLTMFAVIGVNLFSGLLHYRCTDVDDAGNAIMYSANDPGYDTENPPYDKYEGELGELGLFPHEESLCWAQTEPFKEQCLPARTISTSALDCDIGQMCLRREEYENPLYGIIGFDNLAMSFFNVFMISVFEEWDYILVLTQAVSGEWVILYYAVIIVTGACILVNVVVAAIMLKFREALGGHEVEAGGDSHLKEGSSMSPASQVVDIQGGAPAEDIDDDGWNPIDTPPPLGSLSPARSHAGSPLPPMSFIDLVAEQELKRLKHLYKQGLIDEDEYKEGKASIMNVAMQALEKKLTTAMHDVNKEGNIEVVPESVSQILEEEHASRVYEEVSSIGSNEGAGARFLSALQEFKGRLAYQLTWGGVRDDEVYMTLPRNGCTDNCEAKCDHAEAIKRDQNMIVGIAEVDPIKRHDPSSTIFQVTGLRLRWLASGDESPFNLFMTSMIIGNTVVLAMDNYEVEGAMRVGLDTANVCFVWLFAAELIIVYAIMGTHYYTGDASNMLDAFVALVSVVETLASGGGGSMASMLRMLRMLRITRSLRAAKKIKAFRKVFGLIGAGISATVPEIMLMLLFCFMVTILGMQLFGATLADHDEVRFDSFIWSFIQVFITLSGEDWPMGAAFVAKEVAWYAVGYYLFVVLIGQFFIMNLVLAVLLESCADDGREEEQIRQRFKKLIRRVSSNTMVSSAFNIWVKHNPEDVVVYSHKKRVKRHRLSTLIKSASRKAHSFRSSVSDSLEHSVEHSVEPSVEHSVEPSAKIIAGGITKEKYEGEGGEWGAPIHDEPADTPSGQRIDEREAEPKTELEEVCERMHHNPVYGHYMMTLIVLNSLVLMVNTDKDKDPGLYTFVVAFNAISTFLFVVDFFIITTVVGFIEPKNEHGHPAVLQSPTAMLDLIIVLGMIADLICLAFNTVSPFISGFLAIILCLRPLRILVRLDAIREVLDVLRNSMVELGLIVLFTTFLMVCFAILGQQLFSGTFHVCVGNGGEPVEATKGLPWKSCSDGSLCSEEYGNGYGFKCNDGSDCYDTCAYYGGTFTAAQYSFDNMGSGIMSMFVLTTMEGFMDMLWAGVAATEPRYFPIPGNNPYGSIFFMLSIVVFGFFFVQLFLGVVFEGFAALHTIDKKTGDQMSETERALKMLLDQTAKLDPPKLTYFEEKSAFDKMLHRMVFSKSFDHFIMAILCCNGLTLVIQHEGSPQWINNIEETGNLIFAGIYTAEMLIRISVLGFREYWGNIIHASDGVITCGSIADTFMFMNNCRTVTILRVLRSLRVIRVMRLLTLVPGLRVIMKAVLQPWYMVMMTCILLGVTVYVYASVGCVIFPTLDPDDYIGFNYLNFDSIIHAMFLLMVVGTGSEWTDIVGEMWERAPDGMPLLLWDFIILVYFLSFLITLYFIFLNIFIMVVCDAFEVLSNPYRVLVESLMEDYTRIWRSLDENGEGKLPTKSKEHGKDFFHLLVELPAPLGVGQHDLRQIDGLIMQMRNVLNLEDRTAEFGYNEALHALVTIALVREDNPVKFEQEMALSRARSVIKRRVQFLRDRKILDPEKARIKSQLRKLDEIDSNETKKQRASVPAAFCNMPAQPPGNMVADKNGPMDGGGPLSVRNALELALALRELEILDDAGKIDSMERAQRIFMSATKISQVAEQRLADKEQEQENKEKQEQPRGEDVGCWGDSNNPASETILDSEEGTPVSPVTESFYDDGASDAGSPLPERALSVIEGWVRALESP